MWKPYLLAHKDLEETIASVDLGDSAAHERTIVFDGRDIWVSSKNAVYCLSFWDETTEYEKRYGSYFPDYTGCRAFGQLNETQRIAMTVRLSVDLTAHVPVGGCVGRMVYADNHIYVSFVNPSFDVIQLNGATITRKKLLKLVKLKTTTGEVVSSFELPSGIGDIDGRQLTYQHNKIWFTSLAVPDQTGDKQKLGWFNIISEQFSDGDEIPGQKQFTTRAIVNGRDSRVIVGANNHNKILFFDDSLGSFTSDVEINRDPSAIFVNHDKEVLIGSADGMVTSVDQTTEVATNSLSCWKVPSAMVYDDRFVWAITPQLTRVDSEGGDDNLRYESGTDTAEHIITDIPTANKTGYFDLILTPEIRYQYWDGSNIVQRTVEPYVFFLDTYNVVGIRRGPLLRENLISIRATAMIATGETEYYGETTE